MTSGRSVFFSILSVQLFSLMVWAAPGASFDIDLIPAGDFTGKTSEVIGSVTVEGNKVKAENIRVPLKSIDTGMELRNTHTQKHLESDKYPEAILVKGEGEGGKGKGTLKIKGIEKEVQGTYKIEGQEVAAEFKIKLSDFNIKGIKYMGVGVQDDVTLKVRVPVAKAAAPVAPPAKPAGVAPAAPAKSVAPATGGPKVAPVKRAAPAAKPAPAKKK